MAEKCTTAGASQHVVCPSFDGQTLVNKVAINICGEGFFECLFPVLWGCIPGVELLSCENAYNSEWWMLHKKTVSRFIQRNPFLNSTRPPLSNAMIQNTSSLCNRHDS